MYLVPFSTCPFLGASKRWTDGMGWDGIVHRTENRKKEKKVPSYMLFCVSNQPFIASGGTWWNLTWHLSPRVLHRRHETVASFMADLK